MSSIKNICLVFAFSTQLIFFYVSLVERGLRPLCPSPGQSLEGLKVPRQKIISEEFTCLSDIGLFGGLEHLSDGHPIHIKHKTVVLERVRTTLDFGWSEQVSKRKWKSPRSCYRS
jgi:hypothetical protein